MAHVFSFCYIKRHSFEGPFDTYKTFIDTCRNKHVTSVRLSRVEQKRKTDNIQREGNGNNTNLAANESFQPLLKSPRTHPNSSRKDT